MITHNGTTYYGGWLRRPHAVGKVLATLPLPTFADAAPHLKGTGAGKDVFLWDAEKQVLGKLLPSMDQGQLGSCVSHGWGRAVQDLLLIQIAAGNLEAWAGEVAREPIYGGSRVQVGGERGSYEDGSVGAWAAKWVNDWGIIHYGDGGLDGYYTVQRCRQWGADGVPDQYQQLAKQHPAKTVSMVQSAKDAEDALANLYPIAVCSDQGFAMQRSADGFCQPSGTWNHCMCLRGVFTAKGGRRGFVIQNSWGDYLGSANNRITLEGGREIELPQGCFGADLDTVDRMVRQNDSFAVSHAVGFPAQRIPWIYG